MRTTPYLLFHTTTNLARKAFTKHFKAIAEATSIPMVIYNVPGRTVVSMSNDTILRLAEIPNIVGVKEASGNIGQKHRIDQQRS